MFIACYKANAEKGENSCVFINADNVSKIKFSDTDGLFALELKENSKIDEIYGIYYLTTQEEVARICNVDMKHIDYVMEMFG